MFLVGTGRWQSGNGLSAVTTGSPVADAHVVEDPRFPEDERPVESVNPRPSSPDHGFLMGGEANLRASLRASLRSRDQAKRMTPMVIAALPSTPW